MEMMGTLQGKYLKNQGFQPRSDAFWREEVRPVMDNQAPKMMQTTAPGPVVEISLLLPEWQANMLETEAFEAGLSPAVMLRKLLMEHLGQKMSPAKAI